MLLLKEPDKNKTCYQTDNILVLEFIVVVWIVQIIWIAYLFNSPEKPI